MFEALAIAGWPECSTGEAMAAGDCALPIIGEPTCGEAGLPRPISVERRFADGL